MHADTCRVVAERENALRMLIKDGWKFREMEKDVGTEVCTLAVCKGTSESDFERRPYHLMNTV